MTFLDLFAGIGGFRRGMELAGHKCLGFCEWDKYARMSYISMHCITDEQRAYLATLDMSKRQKEILKDEYLNDEWCSTDIREVNSNNIPKADVWCFGAPCLVAGTLITTKDGMKPIEEVEVGDYVLTHANTFERVTERMINRKTGIYTVKVKGSPITEVTGNHRFFVRYRQRVWNSNKKGWDIEWSKPEWVAVENFKGDEYVVFPQNLESVNAYNITENEAWLLGRYVADGYIQDYKRKDRPSNTKRVVWCIGNNKKEEFSKHIMNYFTEEYNSCTKYFSTNHRLFDLCHSCGRGAENKTIPWFIMNLPKYLLEIFIDGYMSGDGCTNGNVHQATSVSKEFIYQLGQCVNKAYGCGYSIYYCKRPKKHIICGREVNQHDTWHITWRDSGEEQSYMIDDVLWQRLKRVTFEKDRTENVYNLEVENEHSYTANNMGLHNCQDFSVAGRRAGLEGDRSSLVREVFRILGEIREEDRPKWLIYENVKGMFSSNKGFDYLTILLAMDELGYDCQWQLLNTKDFGVPQNRERVYTVGCLRGRGGSKVFPLRGSNETNSISVNQVGKDGTSKRDNPNQYRVYGVKGISPALNCMEGGGREPHIPITIKSFGIDKNVGGQPRKVANTITAREDRGVSNQK